MKVKLTVYENHLVIETLQNVECPKFIPAGGQNIGCTLMDTEQNLGASKEAIEWLKSRKKCSGSFSDLMAWDTVVEKYCFSWYGDILAIKGPNAMGDRDFRPDLMPYIEIENNTPDNAKVVVMKLLNNN